MLDNLIALPFVNAVLGTNRIIFSRSDEDILSIKTVSGSRYNSLITARVPFRGLSVREKKRDKKYQE